MPSHHVAHIQDPVLAKGDAILQERQARLEHEAELKKAMNHSVFLEPLFWSGFLLGISGAMLSPLLLSWALLGWLPPSLIFILCALERASIKRQQAVSKWLKCEKTRPSC